VIPTDQDAYPAIFRLYVTRGLRATLDAFDAATEQLDEAQRERGLHLLSYGLRLDNAWGDARDLTLTLAPHLERQGYRQAWMAVLTQALAQAETQDDSAASAQLHLRLGRLHILLGEHAAAAGHLTQAARLAAAQGDPATQAHALERLGLNAFDRSELDAAQHYAEAALALAAPDDPTAVHARHLLAWVAVRRGALTEAIELLQHVLAWQRQQGGRQALAAALRDLGGAYLYTQQYTEAIALLHAAIDLFVALENHFGEAVARMNLGIAHWYRGDPTQALTTFAPCDRLFEQVDARIYLARLYNNRGLVYRDLDEAGRARALFDLSIAVARAEQDFYEIANALDSLAGLHRRTGDAAAALATWQMALDELAHLPALPGQLTKSIREQMAAVEARSEPRP
jgi:tetratricopeptide (TPR) repeat protein